MMEQEERRRIEDLLDRCEHRGIMTSTGFLTPAQAYSLEEFIRSRPEVRCLLSGGITGCERQAAFFLPWYLQEEDFRIEEQIKAVKLQSYFGTPSHRDYMGAVLGLGIRREWLGDILVEGDCAYLFCLPSVLPAILELTQVGKVAVKAAELPLDAVPHPEKKVREIRFTVKSLRLDAVTGDLFGISRTKAAEAIRLGLVSLNYELCQKPDAEVKEGDVLSLKGKGKGKILALGGKSKKDRLFLQAERYL